MESVSRVADEPEGLVRMKNPFISNLHKKDINHFTSNIGLFLRRKLDRPFKKLCNLFTNATIIRVDNDASLSDEAYYSGSEVTYITYSQYPLSEKRKANNIVLERYPHLEKKESYIFVGNHTCPEDIETMLNIIDRNAYLVLGSIETLQYNPEAYLIWLNGMIVFDILDATSRKALMSKMERVLRTNSILIFPEGSHNYHPNNVINHLYDGAVRLALETGKKIVPVSLVRDGEHKVSYIDVGNPIDVREIACNASEYCRDEADSEKAKIKALTGFLRDKMATAVYHLLARHTEPVCRKSYEDMEQYFIERYVSDSFAKLKWKHDVFDAEFLTKKTKEDQNYEEVVRTLSGLRLNSRVLRDTGLDNREYVFLARDLERKDVVGNMRRFYSKEGEH